MPFWYLGGDDVLVAQMVGLVEDFPTEWQQKYRDMCLKVGRESVQGKRLFIVLI